MYGKWEPSPRPIAIEIDFIWKWNSLKRRKQNINKWHIESGSQWQWMIGFSFNCERFQILICFVWLFDFEIGNAYNFCVMWSSKNVATSTFIFICRMKWTEE